jgi:hypothetical protein
MTNADEFKRIKENPEKYNKEKERINNYITNKYREDPEYRAKVLERNKQYYQRMKNKA